MAAIDFLAAEPSEIFPIAKWLKFQECKCRIKRRGNSSVLAAKKRRQLKEGRHLAAVFFGLAK